MTNSGITPRRANEHLSVPLSGGEGVSQIHPRKARSLFGIFSTRIQAMFGVPPYQDSSPLPKPHCPLPSPPVLLIDAYNLLHQWRGNPASDAPGEDLRALAALIRRSTMASGRVRLVCDGTAPRNGGHHTPGVEVIYAGAGQSADEVLIDTVNRSSSPSGLVVVSSDRMIAAAARKRGATVIDSGAFLARLITSAAAAGIERFQPKPLPALPLGDAEVGYWLTVFGETGSQQQQPSKAPKPQIRMAGAELPAKTNSKRSRSRALEPGASATGQAPAANDASPIPKARAAPTPQPARSHSGFNWDIDKAPALGPHDAWIEEARRMWPDLTLDDLRMDRWLNNSPPGTPTRKGAKR
jgi:predicted RNA-binding protein with PIN domain